MGGILMDREFDYGLRGLDDTIAEGLGSSVRASSNVYLGNPETGSVKARVNIDTDQPGMVFVHQVNAAGEVISIRIVRNSGAGRLSDDELGFGRPIRVIMTDDGIEETNGTGGREDAEWSHNSPRPTQRSLDLAHFDALLLRPTDNPSMRLIIAAARVVLDGTVYDIPQLETTDFTAQLPTTPGNAKIVMVEVDPVTRVRHYTYGVEYTFDSSSLTPDHAAAFSLTGVYPKAVASDRFLSGYARIYYGQIRIPQADVYPAQEVFNKGAGDPFANAVTFLGYPLFYEGSLITYEA